MYYNVTKRVTLNWVVWKYLSVSMLYMSNCIKNDKHKRKIQNLCFKLYLMGGFFAHFGGVYIVAGSQICCESISKLYKLHLFIYLQTFTVPFTQYKLLEFDIYQKSYYLAIICFGLYTNNVGK